jgi:DUF971 family protein
VNISDKEMYKPRGISVERELKRLVISWADGHTSLYPFGGLRKSCPCVFCQGGHSGMGKPMDPISFLTDTSDRLNITNISQTGNYAIQITWSDGHNSGIYRWEYLRDGCPVAAGIIDGVDG